MDNTAQNQTNDNTQSQAQPQVQQVRPLSQMPQPEPQVNQTGSINKEVEVAPVSEYVKPSEAPLVKDKEVAEAGVKEVSARAELTKEHEKIGIKPSAESTPVKGEPSENVQLPMTQVQATQVAKSNKNIRDSIVWLAILMLKHFKKMHRKLLGKGS